ncbi:MAG: WYL domain-containing protein [Deltaproteobacteria bacterium]|nr:WYL domain-containing protein [Deltaproteobacteria bacterium]
MAKITPANQKKTEPIVDSLPPKPERLPKDLVLLQLALVLLRGGELTYKRLTEEFLLQRRTAERYMADLRVAGLPLETRRRGREAYFILAPGRSRKLKIEAIDVPPAAARTLSLLLVAAALLPAHLGVRSAVDSTVRAALRLRGLRATSELRKLEDAVLVLENDAKDYKGRADIFVAMIDATLAGHLVTVPYRSPRYAERVETFYPATIGLYKGGLYALAIYPYDDGSQPTWRAMERMTQMPEVDDQKVLDPEIRFRALQEAKGRWGPARPRFDDDGKVLKEQVITLHFSKNAAPYVQARPWHERAEVELWPDDKGGGARMAIRLSGDTTMFESWVRSWGHEVQVLRPADMAFRIADSLDEAARLHRLGPERWAAEMSDQLEGKTEGEVD